MKCCKCGKEVRDGIIAIRNGQQKEPICISCWQKLLDEKILELKKEAIQIWFWG